VRAVRDAQLIAGYAGCSNCNWLAAMDGAGGHVQSNWMASRATLRRSTSRRADGRGLPASEPRIVGGWRVAVRIALEQRP
jgi:hypothetical protein